MSGAGLSTLSAHRRPLATAAAAGGLLCALWFVPSANANPDGPDPTPGTASETGPGAGPGSGSGSGQHPGGPSGAAAADAAAAKTGDGAHTQLAETGSFDSTPFVFGGLGFVAVGGTILVRGRHRAGTAG